MFNNNKYNNNTTNLNWFFFSESKQFFSSIKKIKSGTNQIKYWGERTLLKQIKTRRAEMKISGSGFFLK